MLWILVCMALVNCLGTVALKTGADLSSAIWVAAGIGCYGVGALLYVLVLRGQPLGLASLVTSLTQLVVLILIGQLWLADAPLTRLQWGGLGLALAALVLTAAPAWRV